jgi:NTP pyrophosphatase (non-canonical NTP hydrolase)
MIQYFNKLSPEELERLAILSEELGEAQQVIGKILRHGYESRNPIIDSDTNRKMLEKELGDVLFAIRFLGFAKDIIIKDIVNFANHKQEKINQWLHHNTIGKNNVNSK